MARSNQRSVTYRMNQDAIEYINNSFDASGANSKGEYIVKAVEFFNNSPLEPEVKTITIEKEKELQSDELLLKLNPAQMYAIRGHVLSFPDFAEQQNEVIDSLKGKRPFLYGGYLYEPEFQALWVRNIPIVKNMSEAEKEKAIRHNMAAFLMNVFFVNIIEGNILKTAMNAQRLKNYIQKITPPKTEVKTQKPIENEPDNKETISTKGAE